MSLSVAFNHLVHRLENTPHITNLRILDEGAVWVNIAQPTFDEEMMIYLVAGELSVGFIKKALNNNTQRDMHTLFIVAQELLTDDGETVNDSAAVRLLRQAYHDHIYAYELLDRRLTIFSASVDSASRLRRGAALDFNELCGDYATFNNQHLLGVRKVVNFNRSEQHQTRPIAHISDQLLPFYDLLELPTDADEDMLKRAYRRKARQHHPDADRSPDATAKMQAINEAYERILNSITSLS